MADIIRMNVDLSPTWRIPGVYSRIENNALSTSAGGELNRLLILGEQDYDATKPKNVPYPLLSAADAADGSGARSPVARMARAAFAQLAASGLSAEVWACGVDASGTAAMYTFGLTGTATKAGSLHMWVAGDEAIVDFDTNSTASDVGSALSATINALAWCPVTAAFASGVLTLTARVNGAGGEDLPVKFNLTVESGLTLTAGSLDVLADATGEGNLVLSIGTSAIQVTGVGGTSVITKEAIANQVSSFLGGNDLPVMAGSVTGATVPLLVKNDRIIRRLRAHCTAAGVTLDLGSGTTAGDGSATSITGNGTFGASVPDVSKAFDGIDSIGTFGHWVVPWTDTTSLGVLANKIEIDANGRYQKGARLTVCSVGSTMEAASIPTGTAPALTGSLRYAVLSLPGSGQQGYELAARVAAARAAAISPATNYDGMPLLTTSDVPLMAPDKSLPDDERNAAIQIGYLTPIKYDPISGRHVIVFGRTTSSSSNRIYHDWSYIDQEDWHRYEVRTGMAQAFAGKFLKASGNIVNSDEIDVKSLIGWIQDAMQRWEREGTYDGASALKDLVKAQVDPNDRSRANVQYPESPKIPLHQIGLVAASTLPALP